MTTHLYVQKRGAAGGSHIEFSDAAGRKGSPFFDYPNRSLVELGQRFRDGQASQGTFVVMDPEADLAQTDFNFNLPAHALVTWTEDAPGFAAWLARGRMLSYQGGRGTTIVDNEVEFEATVEDGNSDLRGQAFTENWARPEETDYARLVALQAYTLNGASSTATNHRDSCAITVSSGHLTPNAATVTMPPKKYLVGTQPIEVVADCAETSGKQYGVVIHHSGGSHLCLLYITDNDHTTYLSAAKISDHLDENDPYDGAAPVWEPHWETGRGQIHDGQDFLSGLVTVYATESAVFQEWPDNAQDYDYWVDAYHDGKSTTVAQATARTDGMLQDRRLTQVTHTASVIVQPEQVDLVAAGMSIQIKAAASIGGQYLDVWQTRRIAELRWEPRMDGTYWAHMNLDRPPRRIRNPGGATGAQPPLTPVPASGATEDVAFHFGSGTNHVPGDGSYGTNEDDSGTYGWYSRWSVSEHADVGTIGGTMSLVTTGGYTRIPVTAATTYDISCRLGQRGTTHASVALIAKWYTATTGGSQIGGDETVGTSTATNFGWQNVSNSLVAPGGALGLDLGVPYIQAQIDDLVVTHGGATPAFVGTPVPPAATDITGTVGTSTTYAPIDHQHPVQTAGVTPLLDEADYYVGTNVDAALAEVGAALADPDTFAAFGFVGEILITDSPSTPLIFADLIQNEDQNDLVYADPA